MAGKQKLELTWIGKENRPRLEPRILLEDPAKSYHAPHRVSENNIFDNRLIFGDNLLALKALEQEFTGKVKCIYIDPPYNTGSAFTHYDDGVEHSLWLSLMRDRIEILKQLLADDGTIWITLDDNESHYMKVLCDEIFGRKHFVATVCWKARDSVSNDLIISQNHNFTLLYAKNYPSLFTKRKSFRLEKSLEGFSNPDGDPRGPYKYTPVDGPGGGKKGNPHYTFLGVTGYWRYSEATMQDMYSRGEIVRRGKGLARKYYLTQAQQSGGATATTWWDLVGTATEAKKEIIKLFPDNVFDTPKPERMIERVLTLATEPGDIVLDSFSGSGTTGAVAHKMGRRWIMVELGEHCHTHIIPRLKKVIDGTDPGGVTDACNWKGGGGFRYYSLAPSLLKEDAFGNWVISKEYNPAMLAEAVCKLEGFHYAPSDEFYWMHGHSTETDYIFVTTRTLSREQLQKLNDEVGPNRSLLVCCGAYRTKKLDDFPQLTVKKIPKAVMQKCEWGKDDYSLEIKALPEHRQTESTPVDPVLADLPKNKRKARKMIESTPSLFSLEELE